jgi:hypothetical protein
VFQKLFGWSCYFQDLPNINFPSNPEPPIPFSFPIGHFDDHIHIMGMFLLAPELAAFGGVNEEV